MSGLLLCSSRRSEKPFLVEKDMEIWSLEELCYYLYENVFNLTDDFFSPELLEYLEKDLELEKLAKDLFLCKEEGNSYAEMVIMVCETANYYSREELLEFEEHLKSFSMLSHTKRLKLLGDTCMEKRLYAQALRKYEEILAYRRKEACEEEFIGRVYHNMGIAYAKMLLYKEAEEYLKKSYEMLPAIDSIKKELLLLYYLSGNEEKYKETALLCSKKEQIEAEEAWKAVQESACIEEGRIEAVVEKWKREYRYQMQGSEK